MKIKLDNLTGEEVRELIRQHLASMMETSPPESVHALDLSGLQRSDVTFWSVWEQGELMGCGALKELDGRHGEVKSMRTASAHLRKGVARRMLQHIVDEAGRRGYHRLSLETGATESFVPARTLYESFGFRYCEPFSDYAEDPYSAFMTLELQ
ncbi:GNAT family N-acetyltransferase [Cohnella cellulosilytica]|uniref:GNAT family N-acetyltransferase n=1 Tax=Cohnella cellulosilytica TaxID=986710 RepID=A0ABW2FG00_9BACL